MNKKLALGFGIIIIAISIISDIEVMIIGGLIVGLSCIFYGLTITRSRIINQEDDINNYCHGDKNEDEDDGENDDYDDYDD